MAKRLSRPRFDQLNDTDLNNNNTLTRVQTLNVVDGQDLSAKGTNRDGATTPLSDAAGLDGRLS